MEIIVYQTTCSIADLLEQTILIFVALAQLIAYKILPLVFIQTQIQKIFQNRLQLAHVDSARVVQVVLLKELLCDARVLASKLTYSLVSVSAFNIL